MSDKKFTYTVREEIANDVIRYYAAFRDGSGSPQETEITCEVYLALEGCRKHEKRQINFDERHVEREKLSEAQLQTRMLRLPPSLERLVEGQEQAHQLRSAIAALPEIQRRRLLLYHVDGLTYERIAALEGCTIMPIRRSIACAEEKIREKIKFFEKQGLKNGPN